MLAKLTRKSKKVEFLGWLDFSKGEADTSQWAFIKIQAAQKLVGLGGFEPPTSPLSGVRSNQLSYRPNC